MSAVRALRARALARALGATVLGRRNGHAQFGARLELLVRLAHQRGIELADRRPRARLATRDARVRIARAARDDARLALGALQRVLAQLQVARRHVLAQR